jgi:hypothetical protein
MAVNKDDNKRKSYKESRKKYQKRMEAERLQRESVQATLELVQVVRLDTLHKLLVEVTKNGPLSEGGLRELIGQASLAQDNVGISDAPLPLVETEDLS